MPPKQHIYVPMPQSDSVYGPAPQDAGLSFRDRLIRQYGEVSVMHAEVAVCITVLSELGILKKSEFADMVKHALEGADRRRQLQAESGR